MKNLFNKIYSEVFYLKHKMKNKIENLSDDEKKIYNITYKATSIFCIILLLIGACSNLFIAADNSNPFASTFNSVWLVVAGSATAIGVCLIAINIVTIMTSKNQRKTEQAVTWIKAIAIAWLFLMIIGIFITLIQQMVGNVNTSGSNSQYAPIFEFGN